jgi:hypothetical protein
MSNPGPASTQTTNYLFNGDSTDGIQLAGAATDKLAFHGATPVDQAAAITNLGKHRNWYRNCNSGQCNFSCAA